MVLPDELMERFRCNLGFYASSVSSVDQVALARLLESGDYERHVNRVRVRAREARDSLTALVRKAFPTGEVSIEHADAGLYCTVALSEDGAGKSFAKLLLTLVFPMSTSPIACGRVIGHRLRALHLASSFNTTT